MRKHKSRLGFAGLDIAMCGRSWPYPASRPHIVMRWEYTTCRACKKHKGEPWYTPYFKTCPW